MMEKEKFSPEQVFNCDETGLYFRMLPTTTLESKMEKKAPGYKKQKDRLAVMACSNASGGLKLPLMIIGKSENPRALKGINVSSIPIFYRNQRSAWMDIKLFTEWFESQFF